MKHIQISEEKYNQLATDVSNRLFAAHYFNQGTVNGEEIKKFAEHTQVNKFLLFQIYQVWQMQMSKFRHPYFNFEGEEIQTLLKQLQNELSRNIAIKKEDFKPLLKKAVYNNLKLLLSPKETLGSFFFQSQEKISLDLYERYTPFFSDFDFVVNSINHYYQKNDITSVEKDVFFVKIDKVLDLYNAKSDKDIDSYRDLLFYKLTDKSVKEVVEEDVVETRKREEAKQKEAEKARKLAEAQAEKERKLAEEQAEKARKEEEEKKKKEEKHKQKEEEKARKEEEVRLKAEAMEKAREKSFFETITHEKTFFDLGEEMADTTPTVADTVPEVKTQADKIRESLAETDSDVDKAVTPEAKEEVAVEEKVEAAKEAVTEKAEEVVEATNEEAKAIWEKVVAATEHISTKTADATEPVTDAAKSVFDKVSDTGEAVKEKAKEKAEEVVAAVEEKTEKKRSIFDSFSKVNPFARPENKSTVADAAKAIEEKAEKVTKEVSQEVKEITKEVKEVAKEAKEEIKEEVAKPFAEKVKEATEETATIADKFRQESPVQNGDAVKSGGGQKIQPDEIPIHKQYQYVQKVFGGNNVRFRIIVDKINNSANKSEVEDILNKFVLNNSEVDLNDSVVQEFTELLRTRF